MKSVGSAVVVGDLNDPHSQEFLRGHDMEVTALAISKTGAMVASGQTGTTHRKGFGAPVIVWEVCINRTPSDYHTIPYHTMPYLHTLDSCPRTNHQPQT